MYIHNKKVVRVKVTPIKSESLCNKCEYNYECRRLISCLSCKRHINNYYPWGCLCCEIKNGEPCKNFERHVPCIEFTDADGNIKNEI